MTKFIRDPELREMKKDSRTGIYYVRKKLKGKKELLESTGERDRSKARKIALSKLAVYMAGEPIVVTNPTIRDIADKVYGLKAGKSKATRELAHNRLFKHICPKLGHIPVRSFTENTWENYIIEEAKSGRTLADDAKLMMAVMKYAFLERLIERKIRIRNPDPETEEGIAYTEEQILMLFRAATTANMRLQIMIAYTMGMRHGEIAALRWEWIDWDKNVIKLPAEITKTRRGRVVPVSKKARDLLSSAQATSPVVFPSRQNPLEPIPDFDSQWQRTWKRAGVPGRFHFLRHTCISNMAASGIPESTIRKIVGCSEKTMRKVYLHLKDDLASRAVNLGTTGNLGHAGTKEETSE
jgi:integrase